MAGSRRSPGLKEEWRVTQEPQDNTAFVRDRFPDHERGNNRHRGRRRPGGRDRRSRSPLSSRLDPPSGYEDIVGHRESSPRPSTSRRPSFTSSQSLPVSRDGPRSQEANDVSSEKQYGRGNWEFSQTRRGRSPRRSRRDRNRKNRNANQNRGQIIQQGKPSRRESYRERNPSNRPYSSGGLDQVSNLSFSPGRQDLPPGSVSQRSFSPGSLYEDRNKQGQSPHSAGSRIVRRSPSIASNREGEPETNHHISATAGTRDSSSISQPTSSLHVEARNDNSGNNHTSESLSRHKKMNPAQDFDMRDAPTGPRADRQNNSHYGANNSPYPSGRGGRNRQLGNDQDPYHQDPDYGSSNMPPQRGGYHRGGYQDRRFSSHGPSSFNGSGAHRGRGHFNSSQWIPTGPRDREGQNNSPKFHSRSGSNTPQYQASHFNDQQLSDTHHDDSPRYPGDGNMEDVQAKPSADLEDAQNMPPPPRDPGTSTTPAKEGGKFSFAFKSKANPPPAAKPVPDLAQRMQVREPPRGPAQRTPEQPSRNRMSGPLPPPKYKQDHRPDRRDRDRDSHRGRGRDDRRDFHSRNPRDSRRDDHRFDPRDPRRRDDQRPDRDRRRDRSPEPKRQKRLVQRLKPRQILPEEFRDSDSVYHRKPGDESVIGAGTYGKVFKAIHIYTQDKVALKRIRMEGEKDGFPVTAVREIKLLQHLRHSNVVSLLEVMVEKNECFMVFEYLSHDLTGLINHPTFTLTEAHKKDLAKQMFDGLQYLHHRGVLHRDIKAANILISNRGQLKYADFGLARFFSKSRQLDYTNRVITIWYRPPELLLGDTRYGPAVDIWSAACVFMEMFTKKAVFPGDGKELNQLDKLYSSLGTPTRAEWPGIVDMPWVELMGPTERKKRVFEDTYRDILSPDALDLMCQIFQYDPAKRPTADEVLAHAYFTAEEPGPQQATE